MFMRWLSTFGVYDERAPAACEGCVPAARSRFVVLRLTPAHRAQWEAGAKAGIGALILVMLEASYIFTGSNS